MKRVLILSPIISFMVLVIFLGVSLTRDPSRIPSELIDRPLPQFELPPIQGYERGLKTEDFLGEVTLLNVFGSWCAACRIEHPVLMELVKTDAVKIYGLNWKDKPGDGTAWLARFGDPYTLIGDDQDSSLIVELGVTKAPETFVIDKAGRVRYKHIGPISPDDWRTTLLPLIESLRAT